MGTDIHLEAERQRDDGTWERIPHAAEPCWGCSDYNREKGKYESPKGYIHPWLTPDEVSPEDKVLDERNGRKQVDRRLPCSWCNGTLLTYPQFLKDRHYDVFAILGNVRNGYGFAGVPTSSGFEPISDSRGLPDDLSQDVLDHLARLGETVTEDGRIEYSGGEDDADDLYEILEREKEGYWSLGEHSLSWVLLSEITNYDWDRGVVKEGWVDPGEFERFRQHGSPNSWSGGISGSRIEHISDTEMAHRIDTGDIVFEDEDAEPDDFRGRKYTTSLQRSMSDWDLPDGSVGAQIRDTNSFFCHIKWLMPYRDCVGADFWKTIENLAELAPDGDRSRVRLVFGFDS